MDKDEELIVFWVVQKCLALRETLEREEDSPTKQKMLDYLDNNIILDLKSRVGDNKKIEYLLGIK
jgi:hypothetical protein